MNFNYHQHKNPNSNNYQHDPSYSMYADAVSGTFKKSFVNVPNSASKHSFYAPNKHPFHEENEYFSEMESAIMKSNEPIETSESDEITALGQRGIWINKSESINWKGSHLLSEYSINNDPDPEIVFKKPQQPLEYVQELAIRYLKPPTPPVPGKIKPLNIEQAQRI